MDFQCYCISTEEEIPRVQWEDALLRHLTEEERERVMSFVFRRDQERALLSYLLQKYVIHNFITAVVAREAETEEEAEATLSEGLCYHISRTRENKPYVVVTSPGVRDLMGKREYTFNYNVSHHGNYVGILSHAHLLVGMDIVDITTRASWVKTLEEYISIYHKQLTDYERQTILQYSNEEDAYTHFYVIWALKEAYIKAVGIGMGMNLKEVEFNVSYANRDVTRISEAYIQGAASLYIKGIKQKKWMFEFCSLDDTHLLARAVGPVSAALDSFKRLAWPQCQNIQVTTHSDESTQSIFNINFPSDERKADSGQESCGDDSAAVTLTNINPTCLTIVDLVGMLPNSLPDESTDI